MHQNKRMARIKEILAEQKELTTKEIMSEFNISQDTARRDILRLVEKMSVCDRFIQPDGLPYG